MNILICNIIKITICILALLWVLSRKNTTKNAIAFSVVLLFLWEAAGAGCCILLYSNTIHRFSDAVINFINNLSYFLNYANNFPLDVLLIVMLFLVNDNNKSITKQQTL